MIWAKTTVTAIRDNLQLKTKTDIAFRIRIKFMLIENLSVSK